MILSDDDDDDDDKEEKEEKKEKEKDKNEDGHSTSTNMNTKTIDTWQRPSLIIFYVLTVIGDSATIHDLCECAQLFHCDLVEICSEQKYCVCMPNKKLHMSEHGNMIMLGYARKSALRIHNIKAAHLLDSLVMHLLKQKRTWKGLHQNFQQKNLCTKAMPTNPSDTQCEESKGFEIKTWKCAKLPTCCILKMKRTERWLWIATSRHFQFNARKTCVTSKSEECTMYGPTTCSHEDCAN